MKRKKTIQWMSLFFAVSLLFCEAQAQTAATITLNPNTKYQTITGWEATAQAGALACATIAPSTDPLYASCSFFPQIKDTLYDQVVNDLGINRVRLEIRSGVESTTDYFVQYVTNQIREGEWLDGVPVNDNSDPNVINGNGFKFSAIDHQINNIILPLKQRLEAKGERLFINLNYVPSGGSPPGLFQYTDPREYAEFMLAVYQHMQTKYGFVPDSLEVALEPGLFGWPSASNVINNGIAAAQLLEANGFPAYLIVPSSECGAGTALNFFDGMTKSTYQGQPALPFIRQYVKEFSYHRYCAPNASELQQVANLRISTQNPYNISVNTGMLEWWNVYNGVNTLYEDLKLAMNSAWQGAVFAWSCGGSDYMSNAPCDGTGDHYAIDVSNPNSPRLIMGNRTKWLRHILKYVRAGAVRIDVTSNNTNLDPLAFINPDGTYVVVVWNKTWGGRSFTISGLPAGTYGIKYIQGDTYNPSNIQVDSTKPDVTITAGQSISQNLSEQGVMTIFAKITALKGDVNNDTRIDVLDIQACVNHILLIQDWGTRADVNKDGSVNVLDVQVIVNIILGN